jgi:cysteine-rich repeat protein
MRAGWCVALVGLAATAACIEADLRPCGSLACPVGKTCATLAGEATCLYPEQLTLCIGVQDGTSCTYERIDASCEHEVCLPRGCGNRVRTSDEACDDGNNANGDGCSADCASDETCGNSILDLAANEQCDDGNSDDNDACRTSCVLPRCGDGVLDPLEECEPGEPVSRTCAGFGYYDGDLACSSTCRFDPEGSCAGRCGDTVIQTSVGEICDGAPPQQSCVDLFYDYGRATCTSSCNASGCSRYGWYQWNVAEPDVTRVAGDRGKLAMTYSDRVEVQTDTGWDVRNGNYVDVDVHGDTILVATSTDVELRTQGVWSTLPPPPLPMPNGVIFEAALAETDKTPTVLACGETSCAVLQYTAGAWATIHAITANTYLLAARSAGNVAFASLNTVVWKFPGGLRTDSVGTFPLTIDFMDDERLKVYSQFSSEVRGVVIPRVGPATAAPTAFTWTYASARAIGDVVFVNQPQRGFTITRGIGERVEVVDGPPAVSEDRKEMFVTRDNRLLVISDQAVWEASELVPVQRTVSLLTNVFYTRTTLTPTGDLVLCERNVWVARGTGFASISTEAGSECRALWASSLTNIYAARVFTTPTSAVRLVHWNGDTWIEELLDGVAIDAAHLSGDQDAVVAVLADGRVLERIQGTWTAAPIIPQCFPRYAGRLNGKTYAVARCTAGAGAVVVLRLDAGSWTELYREAVNELVKGFVLNADGSMFYATQSDRVVGYVGGNWKVFPGVGNEIAGTSATDMFALDVDASHPLRHFDGVAWTPIRTNVGALLKLAVSRQDVIAVAAPSGNPGPVSWMGLLRRP